MDPRQKVRTVDYVADREGFHPVLSDELPEHPRDSEAVARAKDRHFQLYAKIAEEHAQHPFPDGEIFLPLRPVDWSRGSIDSQARTSDFSDMYWFII